MQRLREQFGLEFIYSKLSRRGRRKVKDYARLMVEWEEAGPKKAREVDRLLAKKGPGLLARKFPTDGDREADIMLADEADEMDEVEDLVLLMNGRGSHEKQPKID